MAFYVYCRGRIRDLAETKFGRTATGDFKPNSWTLLDFGKSVLVAALFNTHIERENFLIDGSVYMWRRTFR